VLWLDPQRGERVLDLNPPSLQGHKRPGAQSRGTLLCRA
jgi:hypothetical protein